MSRKDNDTAGLIYPSFVIVYYEKKYPWKKEDDEGTVRVDRIDAFDEVYNLVDIEDMYEHPSGVFILDNEDNLFECLSEHSLTRFSISREIQLRKVERDIVNKSRALKKYEEVRKFSNFDSSMKSAVDGNEDKERLPVKRPGSETKLELTRLCPFYDDQQKDAYSDISFPLFIINVPLSVEDSERGVIDRKDFWKYWYDIYLVDSFEKLFEEVEVSSIHDGITAYDSLGNKYEFVRTFSLSTRNFSAAQLKKLDDSDRQNKSELHYFIRNMEYSIKVKDEEWQKIKEKYGDDYPGLYKYMLDEKKYNKSQKSGCLSNALILIVIIAAVVWGVWFYFDFIVTMFKKSFGF